MYSADGSLILEMGEIGVVARSCEALDMDFNAPVPSRKEVRDAFLILDPEDGQLALHALRMISERSVLRPGRGVRRRDVLLASSMLDYYLLEGQSPNPITGV